MVHYFHVRSTRILDWKFETTVEAALNTGFTRRYRGSYRGVGKLNAPKAMIWDGLVRAFNAGCKS